MLLQVLTEKIIILYYTLSLIFESKNPNIHRNIVMYQNFPIQIT